MNKLLKKFTLITMGLMFASTLSASYTVETIAGIANSSGDTDGPGSSATFMNPGYLTIDSHGNLYVPNGDGNLNVRKVATRGDHEVSTLFTNTYVNGSYNGLHQAYGVAAAMSYQGSNILFVDVTGNLVIYNPSNSSYSTSLNAFAETAYWQGGQAIAMDSNYNVYVSSGVAIWKINSGSFSCFAGDGYGRDTGYADGTGTAARFYGISGMAIDSSNNVYVTDSINGTIRMITPDKVVTTIAGAHNVSGVQTLNGLGYSDGPGSSAQFNYPQGIAVDSSGNLYIADGGNHVIRKLTNNFGSYTVSTIAGNPSTTGSADGIGGAASFYVPNGIAIDPYNNIYVSDSFTNIIRKLYIPSTLNVDVEGTDDSILSGRTTAKTMNKINNGTLQLTSTSNAIESLVIEGGVVSISNPTNLIAVIPAVTFNASGNDPLTQGPNTSTLEIAASMDPGSLTFNTNGTVQVDSSYTATLSQPPAGTGTMIKTGAGVVEVSSDLSSSTTLTGINVSSGKFYLAGGKAPVAPVDVASGAILQLASGLAHAAVGGATTIESGAEVLLNAGATVPNTGASDIFSGTLKINSGGKLVLGSGSTWARDVTIGTAS